MSDWIPVTERLPDPLDAYVLVSGVDPRVYGTRRLHVAYIDDDDGGPMQEWRWMTEAGSVIAEVTHWRPLPDSPLSTGP